MTYQENRNKGGRPKAVKGKARTKTISTRLTLAEWKTVMKRINDAGRKRPTSCVSYYCTARLRRQEHRRTGSR